MDTSAAIANAYKTYLGRDATPDEINWHLGEGSNAVNIIAGSPEAKARAAGGAPAASSGSSDNAVLQNFANQYTTDYQNMLNSQNAKQDDLFNQYKTALGNQEKLPDLYNRLTNELGIPEISKGIQVYKDQIYNVKGLLDRLDEDVTSRNLGTYTTSAMRDRMVTSESQPLQTTLSRLGTGMQPLTDQMTSAQGQLSTLLPLYEQQQDKELSPLKMQIDSLSDRFAREITGFTSEREQSLNAIMDKLQRDRELSDREWQAAQDLAKEQRAYANAASSAGSYLGGGGGSVTSSGGGSTTGGAVANQYIGNNDLRGRLSYLAQNGDQQAALALKYVGNDGKYNLQTPAMTPAIIAAMNRFGFTNAYKASTPSYVAPSGSSVLKLIGK